MQLTLHVLELQLLLLIPGEVQHRGGYRLRQQLRQSWLCEQQAQQQTETNGFSAGAGLGWPLSPDIKR